MACKCSDDRVFAIQSPTIICAMASSGKDVAKKIEALGAKVSLRRDSDGKPFLTDENNYILDCRFGQIQDADRLARQLSDMPGVVEHGLFIGMANVVLVANGSEVVELRARKQ